MPAFLVPPEFDPTYPLFPVFSFIGFVLCLAPFPWHLQAWNAGTCIYMLWTSLACLVEFIDSVVWYGSLRDVTPVWCDISTKFLIGAGVGIPASSLCIARRLHKITSVSTVSVSRREKLRSVYIDIAIAIGIPMIVMALHYIVQGHRYNIIENVGCTPDIWNTVPAYPLVFIWPVVLGGVTFVYAGLTLRSFYVHRIRFNQVISSNTSLTVSRYLRLIALCCTVMLLVTPLSAFSIYINTAGQHIQPWVSWANTHYNFSFVELFPTFVWQGKLASHIAIEMGRWVYPCSGIIFFMLFGFADEAKKFYIATFWRIARLFGKTPKPQSHKSLGFKGTFRMPDSSNGDVLPPYSLPVYSRKKPTDSAISSFDTFKFDPEKGVPLPSPPLSPLSSPSESDYTVVGSERDLSPGQPAPVLPPAPVPDQHDVPEEHNDCERESNDSDSESDVQSVCIRISDEHPPSTPPTPQAAQPKPLPTHTQPGGLAPPAYHRPFSPPVAWPSPAVMAVHRKGSAGSISILVHTETHTF
ncbi:hypothetical protein V8D89_008031 [Ganoderma adspersum]